MASAASTLRIATFNVNGVRSRLGHLLAWLERERPDIACLQELKAPDSAFPLDAIRQAGYGAVWHGQTSWNGVAILARGAEPVEICRGLPGAREDTQARYLEAAALGVVVGCVYLPNGNPQPGPKFDYKLAWFERLASHLRPRLAAEAPVVIAGDFNVVPTDEDIYDPKSWRKDALLQPESRAHWRELLDQGWLDALRTVHPDERIYTFWDYFRQHWPRDRGLRIDHLLLNRHAAPMLRDAGVDRWVRDLPQASDHAPVWVTLKTNARPARRAAQRVGTRATARRR